RAGNGFFGTAMTYMLASDGALRAAPGTNSEPTLPAKAKACIFLFMVGGPSHLDTFDPKPTLARLNRQRHSFAAAGPIPAVTGEIKGSPFNFPKRGQSGIEVSELFPRLGDCVDDMAIIRGNFAHSNSHNPATLEMTTGTIRQGMPSIGSWIYYGLGTANRNLPGFVVLLNRNSPPVGGPLAWSSSFLPPHFQGTVFGRDNRPAISNARSASNIPEEEQRRQLEALNVLNRGHRATAPHFPELDARIASYELAFAMQKEAPDAVDLSRESAETLRLYGIGNDPRGSSRLPSDSFGRDCLTARRLVERGVRFVQLFHGPDWDTHGNNDGLHRTLCGQTDQPIAGLLTDLKRRGMLDETLVVWAGEFGRTPLAEGSGRNHHAPGFTTWLAGGGIRGGVVHGATDEFGYAAVEGRTHIHDLHATILHQMGLDHERLTYRYNGRDFRLTDVEGHVIREIIA
ncbi:MAG: DUF1501 domain-containing protein, partial [Planctomycetota bacterium]